MTQEADISQAIRDTRICAQSGRTNVDGGTLWLIGKESASGFLVVELS